MLEFEPEIERTFAHVMELAGADAPAEPVPDAVRGAVTGWLKQAATRNDVLALRNAIDRLIGRLIEAGDRLPEAGTRSDMRSQLASAVQVLRDENRRLLENPPLR